MSINVIDFQEMENGIVQITMNDKENKNSFTDSFINELLDVYQHIENNPTYKVVILVGFDNYFCTGGTKDSLIKLCKGENKFTDINIYRLPLDCPIPVIAVMKGHAIGGGFVMGMFCDFVMLSAESIYTANFMNYGFTPGMGATYIIPKKIGFSLSHEMLMTGKNYRGHELQSRGIPFSVFPKKNIVDEAYKLANLLSQKPRHSLVILKKHMLKDIKEEIVSVFAQEVELHEQTLHHPEVKSRIESLYINND